MGSVRGAIGFKGYCRGWQRGRQSEGRVCGWVCVQGLRGSKASHFRVLMLTQPP